MHPRRHARTVACLMAALCCGSCGPKTVVTPAAAPPGAPATTQTAVTVAPAAPQLASRGSAAVRRF